MKQFYIGLACGALALAGTVHAAEPEKKDASQQMVCKRDRPTGTRFEKKVCKTRAQWDEIAEASKRAAHEMIDRPVLETRRD